MEQRAVLRGGPCSGRMMHMQHTPSVIVIPYLPPATVAALADPIELPKWRWWHRLLRRPGPFPPDPPSFRELRYRATGEAAHGHAIYQYEETNHD